MIINHLKIAWRNSWKNKAFSMINIVGLALGIWCSLMISLWVLDEFSQDAFHENGKRICQVLQNVTAQNGKIYTGETTAYPVGDALANQFPEIVARTRFASPQKWALNIFGEMVEAQVAAADASFFNVFSFPLQEGNSETCLTDLTSIVISQDLADNYFHEGNAVGKTLDLLADGMEIPFTVTGVFKNIPEHSSLDFSVIIPIGIYLPFNTHYDKWTNAWLTTYVLLEEGAGIEEVNQKIIDLPKTMAGANTMELFLQPFKDRYLYSKYENGKTAGGRIDYIKLFLAIAAFTLLIACFNFINLTTAWSVIRSKEVGIKKVLGAGNGSLSVQFFLESTILVLLASVMALILAQATIPLFNQISSKDLNLDFFNPKLILTLLAIVLITVLCSGIYPSALLSSFKPVNALKGKIKGNISQALMRKGLVIVQFFLCSIMVIGTLAVYLQLRYIQDKSLGLNKENVIYVPMDPETYKHAKTIKAELAKFPAIKEVSASNAEFIDNMGRTTDPVWEGKNPESRPDFAIIDVDFDFMEMMGISLTEGRHFSRDFAGDSQNYIINEAAAKVMDLENPVGKSLSFWGDEGGKIIGVVKDFHFASMHHKIDPMIIRCRPSNVEFFYVISEANKTKETIANLEMVHKQFSSLPFNFHFLDDTLEKVYDSEQKVEKLGGIFAVMAIFISCMGLFGLAAFTANRRTKEIAIRKVLGASVIGLFHMMSKDFVKLILIALLLAIPISSYFIHAWIQSFAFHIDIGWWIFAVAGLAVLFIALSTVSYHILKATGTNPVKNLKNE